MRSGELAGMIEGASRIRGHARGHAYPADIEGRSPAIDPGHGSGQISPDRAEK